MKPTTAKSDKADVNKTGATDVIADYAKAQTAEHAAICQVLRTEIDAVLTKATSKIWHAIPVWFIGENPVVGYKATPKHVNLLFWNGQAFEEPALKAAGKFKAAQIQFTAVSQIDPKTLRRWLKKAGKDVWNYRGLINGK
jgi:uncharacterized protein YdhG (YjbR/CyaY superfamily)